MLWLYLGWRVFRRIAPLVLVVFVGGALLIDHGALQHELQQTLRGRGPIAGAVSRFDRGTQHDIRQAIHGRGQIGASARHLRNDVQRGLDRHLLDVERRGHGADQHGRS
jgi:hypothetical protein